MKKLKKVTIRVVRAILTIPLILLDWNRDVSEDGEELYSSYPRE